MLILGIESSCDDTSVALLNCSTKGHRVLSEKTASQIDLHQAYGGVVPELAARAHAEAIVPLIETVLRGQPRPEVIAVTAGPGLITALLVGVEAARALAYAWKRPLAAVNHIEGHIHSVELDPAAAFKIEGQRLNTSQFPALALVVSGGHTELVLMRDHGAYELVGRTRDDAAGECFDKVAKLLGLPYPGGPHISRLGLTGNPAAIPFPRPMLDEATDFSAENKPAFGWSFAGLKTAARYWLRDHPLAATHFNPIPLPAGVWGQSPEPPTLEDFCASLEQAIVDVLVEKTIRAARHYRPRSVLLCGGVAANQKLRQSLLQSIHSLLPESTVLVPPLPYCADNGAMIAVAGYYQALKNNFTDWKTLTADPNWKIA